MLSVDDLNALRDKVKFCEDYLNGFPENPTVIEYISLWDFLIRLCHRLSSTGDMYSLINLFFAQSMADRINALKDKVSKAANSHHPHTKRGVDFTGYEEIFTHLYNKGKAPTKEFLSVYNRVYLPVEGEVRKFLKHLNERIDEREEQMTRKVK